MCFKRIAKTNVNRVLPRQELTEDESQFFNAIYSGDTNVVSRFLNDGMNPNQVDLIGRSALLEALLHKHTEIACLLLSYGAHPDATAGSFSAPLGAAINNDDVISVRTLLQHGADVNNVLTGAGSSLHAAVHVGNTEILRLLLEHGANLDATNEDGITALASAKLCQENWPTETSLEIVHILEQAT